MPLLFLRLKFTEAVFLPGLCLTRHLRVSKQRSAAEHPGKGLPPLHIWGLRDAQAKLRGKWAALSWAQVSEAQ